MKYIESEMDFEQFLVFISTIFYWEINSHPYSIETLQDFSNEPLRYIENITIDFALEYWDIANLDWFIIKNISYKEINFITLSWKKFELKPWEIGIFKSWELFE